MGRGEDLLKLLMDNLRVASIAAFVIGVTLVLIAELGGIHETRIFGAALITLGGVGLGIDTGLADPRSLRVPGWLREWRSTIGVIAAILAVGPVVIVLVGVLAGVFGDAGGDRSAGLLAIGTIIGLLMLLAVVATTVISVRSIARAAHEQPSPSSPDDIGREGEAP